jgi:hypothetical protein
LNFRKRWLGGTTICFSEKKSTDNQQQKKLQQKRSSVYLGVSGHAMTTLENNLKEK